ncbi:hypothetical protein GCM10009017_27800 [Halarchaeum rubridurum]|uniref:Uncharacterized protein n=1 Tax=Halarchaeum rubridurum TaxID=489911 RepID=A0A830G4V0_9EURY|nr:hypothetical protein GCM10009017_27800 [Halarchaeum rubridurum]
MRALGLAALLLVSVVAGSVAFAGGAAAKGTSNATVTAEPTTAGATANHTVNATIGSDSASSALNGLLVDYDATESATTVGGVRLDTVHNASIYRANDSTVENVTDDLDAVNQSNDGHTLTFTFGGSYQLHEGDVVHVSYGGVGNPTSAGEYEVAVVANPQSQNAITTNYTVTADPANLNATLAPNGDGVESTHTLVATPGSAYDDVTLDSATVDYGWDVRDADPTSTPTAFVDRNGNATYDAGTDTKLNVTAPPEVDGANDTVSLDFDGAYTLNATDSVVLRYESANAETIDDYTVGLRFDGGERLTDGVSVTDGMDWDAASLYATPAAVGASGATHTVGVHDFDAANHGNSLNSVTIDYGAGEYPADVSDVGRDDIEEIELYHDGSYVDVTDDLSEVDGSDDGTTLTLGFGGDYTVHEGDSLDVRYDDVTNPDANASVETTVAVGVNGAGSPAHATLSLTYRELGSFFLADRDDAVTNATHVVYAFPGQAQDGAELDTVTVRYGGDAHAFDGDLSGVTANTTRSIVAESRFGFDTETQPLDVTRVEASADAVTFHVADGNYTMSPGHLVGLGYWNVENPTTAGDYWVNVSVNGNGSDTTNRTFTVEPHTNVTSASLDAANDTAGATTTYTLRATIDTGANPADRRDVLEDAALDLPAYAESGLDEADWRNASVDAVEIERADGSTEALTDYHVHAYAPTRVHVTGDVTVSTGDTLVVTYAGVENPANATEGALPVRVNDGERGANYSVVAPDATDDGASDGSGAGEAGDADGDAPAPSGDTASNSDGVSESASLEHVGDDDSSGTEKAASNTSDEAASNETTSTATTRTSDGTTTSADDTTGDADGTTGDDTDANGASTTSTAASTSSGSTPGFGVATALLALAFAAAALLARRD